MKKYFKAFKKIYSYKLIHDLFIDIERLLNVK